jgi:regulator of nucleoside diphosphate kinase
MKYGKLILEKKEYVFLKRLLYLTDYYKDQNNKDSLKKLGTAITNALICDHEKMPEDVIRFNSLVTLQSEETLRDFQLVIPKERDIAANKISVLAPMGSAVMGYALGDSVSWKFLDGFKNFQIVSVKQAYRPVSIDVRL